MEVAQATPATPILKYTQFFGFVNGHFGHRSGRGGKDILVDQFFHFGNLFDREGGEMGKVKAANGIRNVGARLLDVVAQHAAKRTLQQVRRRVVAHNGGTAVGIDLGLNDVAGVESSLGDRTEVQINAVGLFGIQHVEHRAVAGDNAGIADLTAALAVEGGSSA